LRGAQNLDGEAHKQNPSDVNLEVVVERILPGGLGFAHADGRTVMVALAAPGDRLRVRIDRVKGNVAFASIVEIIEPSSFRIEPPCPYFGRCGGCDFQQLNYQAQLDAKVEIIRDCLRRIGGIEHVPEFQTTPAPNVWHYRARAQWQYDSVRRRLGYFESGSRRVCDVAECAVLVPELQRELEHLRKRMQQGALPDDTRNFRAIAGDDRISIADDKGRSLTLKEGLHDITRTIHGERYRLNAESFFQTNADLLPHLIDAAIGEAHGRKAVELYCGVGLFTVPLARRFASVVGVEGDAPATDFARQNMGQTGLTNAEIVNQDVADWLEKHLESREQRLERKRLACNERDAATELPHASETLALQSSLSARNKVDFLLLDPPRTGAESRVISGILGLRPKRICYVSCDPATLARDLKKLIAGGYAMGRLAAFDMFPQTHHVETVVHMTG
jgi:23S rRNA (uracil1939-C5)-methyltransferase